MKNGTGPASSESELHQRLLQLWCKFLKLQDISIDDDFFERGGDSLVAIDLQLELQRMTGRQLPESILFDAPTVREMARALSGSAVRGSAGSHGHGPVTPQAGAQHT
jgi:acyl carrier protein